MDTTAIKTLTESLRQISTDVKRLRACDQILQGYVRLNSSGDGVARAIGELQAAADELSKRARAYAKSVSDLTAAINTSTAIHTEESSNG
jgi:hypothetical protein